MKTEIFSIFLLLSTISAFGQGSGFQVLDIAPTPYGLSKAEATTSIAEGAASIYSNPALLALNNSSTIDLGYSFWIAGVNNIFGGVNFKNGNRAIAFSFFTSGADDYEQYDNPGESNGTFGIQQTSISAAYAHDFSYFSIGGAFQYLNEENFTYRANGYALNAGLASYLMNDKIRLGISVVNLGEMDELNVSATPLPSSFKAGISSDVFELTAEENNSLPVLFSVFGDYVVPLEEMNSNDYTDYQISDSYFNLGLSIGIAETLEISGGYKTQNSARPVSFGASFNTSEVKVNYALVPFNTGYGTVHSIGIQYKF